MQSLLVLIRKVKTYFKMPLYEKVLIIEAVLLTGLYRLVILSIQFKNYRKFIGNYNKETPFIIEPQEYETAKKVSWAVNIVSGYTPWESKCLVQALAAQRMLKNRKISSTLYLGLNKNRKGDLKAHAWLRCGQTFITGGFALSEFKEVAKFSNM